MRFVEKLTHCSETEESVLPLADVERPLVQTEQPRHPFGDFRTHRQELARKVSPDLRLPDGRRVEPMIVARCQVDDALIQRIVGRFLFDLLDDCRAVVLIAPGGWPQELLQAVRDAFDLEM